MSMIHRIDYGAKPVAVKVSLKNNDHKGLLCRYLFNNRKAKILLCVFTLNENLGKNAELLLIK